VSRTIVPGPTYAEMRNPMLLSDDLRAQANAARADELNPLNLFNINWRNTSNQVERIVLPKELTGVQANIVVLSGRTFPSGSMKVGPAYATLAENEALDHLRPGDRTVIGPSTGNFGIGTAYVSLLKGYKAIVVMPDNMSEERYDRIQKYKGDLDLTPGTESDVILTLERTHSEYVSKPDQYVTLAQFELLPNYRFHRHVTGKAVVDAVKGIGNGRVAAFASAPGSAGTLAAGDYVKAIYPDAKIVALEPRECSTLYDGGQGQHRIEGIGDKMVTLIHNVYNSDLLMLIHDEDTVRGMEVHAKRRPRAGGSPRRAARNRRAVVGTLRAKLRLQRRRRHQDRQVPGAGAGGQCRHHRHRFLRPLPLRQRAALRTQRRQAQRRPARNVG
jgi:cysteine synthase A